MRSPLEEASDIWKELTYKSDAVDCVKGLRTHIEGRINGWQDQTASFLKMEFPFEHQESAFKKWRDLPEAERESKENLKAAVQDYLGLCKEVGQPENRSYWKALYDTPRHAEGAMAEALKASFVSPRQLMLEWQKTLDRARADWELEQFQKRRAALIDELKTLLGLFDELRSSLDALGLETGLLLDFSQGELTAQDIEQFKRWARYLSEDDGVRSLCDLMGKIRQMEQSDRIERIKVEHVIETHHLDVNSKEEIVGIRLGSDLEHVLPSELALLADAETEVLFDLKYLEARLMCFDMQGVQASKHTIEVEQDSLSNEGEKLGPMVICVDTSGSMAGMPETIAKAVTLYMASKAKEQKRPCYLINFSTRISTLDMADGLGLGALMEFLGMSFHGGTDVTPALAHALEVMERETYEKADVLVISDFIMAGLPKPIDAKIGAQRDLGNRFYSLVINRTFMTQRLISLFDHEWVFDPSTSSVHEIVGFQQRVAGQPDQ